MTVSHASTYSIADRIAHDGWAVTAPCVPQLMLDRVSAELETLAGSEDVRGGIRNLFEVSPAARAVATSRAVRDVAEAVLGPHCFAVRALLFDKTPSANWKVTWHQDVTIAVRARERVDGYGPWSEKGGVPHVQAPAELMERMLAVRVHLDDCGPSNGPVRVLNGSHRVGRLSGTAIDAWRSASEPVDCLVERGGILAFRPLILHASSPATVPGRRRVLHFDFAAEQLPMPLEWHDEVA